MTTKSIRIRLTGDLDDATAAILGGRIERIDSVEFVADYLDWAQITGLLVQLADLHLPYDRVEIDTTDSARPPRWTPDSAAQTPRPAVHHQPWGRLRSPMRLPNPYQTPRRHHEPILGTTAVDQ